MAWSLFSTRFLTGFNILYLTKNGNGTKSSYINVFFIRYIPLALQSKFSEWKKDLVLHTWQEMCSLTMGKKFCNVYLKNSSNVYSLTAADLWCPLWMSQCNTYCGFPIGTTTLADEADEDLPSVTSSWGTSSPRAAAGGRSSANRNWRSCSNSCTRCSTTDRYTDTLALVISPPPAGVWHSVLV